MCTHEPSDSKVVFEGSYTTTGTPLIPEQSYDIDRCCEGGAASGGAFICDGNVYLKTETGVFRVGYGFVKPTSVLVVEGGCCGRCLWVLDENVEFTKIHVFKTDFFSLCTSMDHPFACGMAHCRSQPGVVAVAEYGSLLLKLLDTDMDPIDTADPRGRNWVTLDDGWFAAVAGEEEGGIDMEYCLVSKRHPQLAIMRAAVWGVEEHMFAPSNLIDGEWYRVWRSVVQFELEADVD